MKAKPTFLWISAFAVCSLAWMARAEIISESTKGDLEIKQIDVINFAPNGVLLIGNGSASEIIALETGDTTAVGKPFQKMPKFLATLAEKIGVGEADVELIDMEVNPASGKLYVAIRNQKNKANLIVRVTPDGEMEPVPMKDVTYARIPLPKGDKAPVSKITDVLWIDNRLIASARCAEEFASKIFSADGPLKHDKAGSIYSAETYHVAHRKWETKAPMSVMIPYEENGKHYIVGAFSCTPVVKYPIDSIQPGAKIKGISMIELGSGNRPLDMFGFSDKDGEPQVITNTFRFHHEKRPYGPSPHLAFQFDQDLLNGSETVNENATRRLNGSEPATDRIKVAEPFHGVVHMSRIDDSSALAIQETGDLVAIALQ